MTKFIETTPTIKTIADYNNFDFNGQQLINLIIEDAREKGIAGDLEEASIHYGKRALSPLNYAQAKEDIKSFISKRKSLKITSFFSNEKDYETIHESVLTIIVK